MNRIIKNYIWILVFFTLAVESVAEVTNTNQNLHFRNIEYHSVSKNSSKYDDYIEVNLTTSNGNDSIIVEDDIGSKRDKHHGGRRSIMTSNGKDTLLVGDDVQYGAMIDMGNGDDRIKITGSLEDEASVSMGNGNDSVDIHTMKSSSLLTGSGDDTVTIQRIDKGLAVIHLGMGDDILYLKNVSSRYDKGRVELGLGRDSLIIEDTLSGTKSIFDGGLGEDNLILTSVSKEKWNKGIKDIFKNFEKVSFEDGSSITLDANNNEIPDESHQTLHFRNIEYHSDTQNHTAYDDYIQINLITSSRNDEIIVEDDIGGKKDKNHGGSRSVTTSDGDDTLLVGDDIQYGAMIDMGNGDNRIKITGSLEDEASVNMGKGNDSVDIHTIKASSLFTGNGDDSVVIQRIDKGLTSISLGSGEDTLYIKDVSSRFDTGTIKLDEGDDQLTIEDTLRGTESIFDGGEGEDHLILKNVSKEEWENGIKDIFLNFEKVTFEDGRSVDLTPNKDSVPPVITLNGEANVTLTQGDMYEELGATALDDVDGELNVSIRGEVDISLEGIYSITYFSTDNTGNTASVQRIVTIIASTLTELNLESNATTLNVGEGTELTVIGTYSDDSTKDISTDIEYIITPSDSAEMKGTVLRAKKDENITVQVKVDGILSNIVNLNIIWVVDGHVLPPEPDPIINNATLGGIDSNNNGVRDDVERNIYEIYSKRLHRGLLMYGARVFQETMTRPLSEAKEIANKDTKAINCQLYLRGKDLEIKSDEFDTTTFLENKTFNTKERIRKYLDYNIALSGGSYGSSPKDWNREACSPEVIRALEEMKK